MILFPIRMQRLLPNARPFTAKSRAQLMKCMRIRKCKRILFSEIHVDADNDGSIYACRKRGFEALEAKGDFLENVVVAGSYGEDWSLRKVLRRFIWHDRIHAKAMYRMATKVFGAESIENPFYFLRKES